MTSVASKNAMLELITNRHCKRAYLDKKVARSDLEAVFAAAINAPSSRNNQPWGVVVLEGARRDKLSARLMKAYTDGQPQTPDYTNRQKDLPETLRERVNLHNKEVFDYKGITRDDKAAQDEHRAVNFEFFGAPTELLFHLPAGAAHGAFLDLGCFMQNVMLGLNSLGIACCPQYSVASYAVAVKEECGDVIPGDRIIVSAMAVGYADPDNRINAFVPTRAPLSETVTFAADK